MQCFVILCNLKHQIDWNSNKGKQLINICTKTCLNYSDCFAIIIGFEMVIYVKNNVIIESVYSKLCFTLFSGSKICQHKAVYKILLTSKLLINNNEVNTLPKVQSFSLLIASNYNNKPLKCPILT